MEFSKEQFLACCGSTKWAALMHARQPFSSAEELHAGADAFFVTLVAQDWRQAFAAHPRIGDTSESAWSKQEQAGAVAAPETTLAELAQLNHEYFRKFGYIFIVCATGKTAAEMLGLLKQRIGNAPADELPNAAAEQKKITHLRIDKMLS